MRGWLVILMVAACGPTTPATTTPVVATGATGCVRDQGCPATAAIAACAGRMAARPFTEIMDQADQLVGQEVHVAGTLYQGGAGCTRMHCGERACCNRCSGRVELGPDAALGLSPSRLPLDGAGGRFSCEGDDTGLCCGVPLDGGVVVTTGRMAQDNGSYSLQDAKVCAP